MANHITSTAVPTEEPTDSAENSSVQDVPSTTHSSWYQAVGPIPGQYVLTRAVRNVVAASSASLMIAGLALAVLGGVGKSNGLQGLSGLNAIVTGVTLIFAGSFGCLVVFLSGSDKVARWKMIVLVTACHASGAFAVQCAIISGQLIGIDEASCEDSAAAPEGGMGGDVVTSAAYICVPDTTRMTFSILILALSVVGFVLGIVCSAFCYYTAPRIWCCLCDLYAHTAPPQRGTAAESRPVLRSVHQRPPDA